MSFPKLVRALSVVAATAVTAVVAAPLHAGFTGTDVVITATARTAGAGTSQFYSTLLVTNVSTSTPVDVDYRFLRLGQPNPSPASVKETLAAGETRRYDNVLKTLFGFDSGAAGAIRITASGRVLAVSRTFDQPPGSDIKDVKGLFFGAVPASFAVGKGDGTILQGISQGGSEDYRYNFGMVEVTGQAVTARVTLRGAGGALLLTKDYPLGPYEALQRNVSDLGAVATTNGRLDVSILDGAGKALVYGTQIANGSQDSAGVEMSFKDGLLAENAAEAAIESTAAGITASATAVIAVSYDQTSRLASQRAPQVEAPTYDPGSGYWTVTVNLPTGQSGQIQVKFLDATGQPQKFYNPLTTRSMASRGSLSGTAGDVAFDLTLSGLGSTSSSFIVNGSGSATIQGVSGTFQVSNVSVPKSPGAYPTSGTITVVASGSTVTVSFNGTRYATGTYTYRGITVPFTIDLDTGEVTH